MSSQMQFAKLIQFSFAWLFSVRKEEKKGGRPACVIFKLSVSFAKHSLTHITTPMTTTNMREWHSNTNLSKVLAWQVNEKQTQPLSLKEYKYSVDFVWKWLRRLNRLMTFHNISRPQIFKCCLLVDEADFNYFFFIQLHKTKMKNTKNG